MVVVVKNQDHGGAESRDALIRAVQNGVADRSEDRLLAVADPNFVDRADAVRQLINRCGNPAFASAAVTVSSDYGPEAARADFRLPQGPADCRELTLSLTRLDQRWYAAFGDKVANPRPSSGTDR
ncbi:hypothetical protein [Kribbella voronezhensis]|uniref:hypothetical protein n=1 Tax=Kribbella voronezhensis TaxID=2512212 RepID=UPI00106440E5|nr:hypothetical protein [Kribbella voronezhensis]